MVLFQFRLYSSECQQRNNFIEPSFISYWNIPNISNPKSHPPFQAHGQGEEFSSADNTDTDLDERHSAIAAVADAIEFLYWADNEDESINNDQLGVTSKKVLKCLRLDI